MRSQIVKFQEWLCFSFGLFLNKVLEIKVLNKVLEIVASLIASVNPLNKTEVTVICPKKNCNFGFFSVFKSS